MPKPDDTQARGHGPNQASREKPWQGSIRNRVNKPLMKSCSRPPVPIKEHIACKEQESAAHSGYSRKPVISR
jgi:hypothetical protein